MAMLMRDRRLVWLAAVLLIVTGLAWIGRPPNSSAEDVLVATIVEASDLHADGALNDGDLLATSTVAAAQNPDAVMLAGDLTNHGYASEFEGLWGSGWGALKPKILASPGNHEEDDDGQAEFMSQFGYSETYNTMDVNGVHVIAMDVDITSASPSMQVGGEQYSWLKDDLAAHANMPILAMSHFPRYSVGDIHGDQDSTEIRNAWDLLQQAGAEIVFAGHDHTYQRFPKANSDGTLNPTSGLREILGATGGSGDLYPVNLAESVLTPDYYQNTTEGIIRIRIYTHHLEWAHVGVDGVTRDLGTALLNHPAPTPGNASPMVDPGTDQTITLPDSATLDGTVTDDGLPDPPAALTTTWSKASGPGTVTFLDPTAVDTTAWFDEPGTYLLQLTATDSDATTTDTVAITVQAPGTGTLERRAAAGSDDVEQAVSGSVYLNSSDLELTTDGSTQQVVGTRFTDVQVPHDATVTTAYVQFQVDESSTGPSSITINAEDSDNAATYTTTNGSVTSRPVTGSVAWSPPDWTTVGAAGADQRTPNIAALVQAVINRDGWSSGNALALQFSGTGYRVAQSFEGSSSGAPLLHVEWTTEGWPSAATSSM